MLTLEIEGLEGAQSMLRAIADLGGAARLRDVLLRSVPREDSTEGNAEILGWLDKGGREFGEVGQSEAESVAKVAAEQYESEVARIAREAVKRGAGSAAADLAAGLHTQDTARLARAAQVRVGRAMMRRLMEIVTEHIERQCGPDGAALSEPTLSPAYAEEKRAAVGFEYPIGKRTGQLLENLNASVASGKIKVQLATE